MSVFGRLGVAAMVFLSYAATGQERPLTWAQNRGWDFAVSATVATGDGTQNSFTQAQIWTAGVFVGKMITGEVGGGWRTGTLEYWVQSDPGV